MTRHVYGVAAASVLVLALAAMARVGAAGTSGWWSPGDGGRLPAYATYANDYGEVGVLNTSGPVDTKGHPFFEPIGDNGRACVSCHQPANGMSLSVAAIQERWRVTQGTDPIFAAVDGMNCPRPAGGRPEVALAAARARPVPRVPAVAAGA